MSVIDGNEMVIEGFIKSSVYLSICSSIHQSIHSFFRIMIVEISDFWSCCDFLQFLPQWLDQAPDRHNGSSGVRAPCVWSPHCHIAPCHWCHCAPFTMFVIFLVIPCVCLLHALPASIHRPIRRLDGPPPANERLG